MSNISILYEDSHFFSASQGYFVLSFTTVFINVYNKLETYIDHEHVWNYCFRRSIFVSSERNEVAGKRIQYENKVKVKFLARHDGVLWSGDVAVLVRYLSTSCHIQVSATLHPGKTSRLSIE